LEQTYGGGNLSAATKPRPSILASELLPVGTRIKVLPLRNDAGKIITESFDLTGKVGRIVGYEEGEMMALLDGGWGEWRLDADRVAATKRRT
jgi:hypothetical protein